MITRNRPLSPHLTVYKPLLTSTLSIFHRISGGFLSLIFLFSIFLLKICDLSLNYYSIYLCFFYLTVNLDWLLFSLTNLSLLAFSYHITNGIRHLLWDFGFFLDLPKAPSAQGSFTLLFSAILCILLFLTLRNLFI